MTDYIIREKKMWTRIATPSEWMRDERKRTSRRANVLNNFRIVLSVSDFFVAASLKARVLVWVCCVRQSFCENRLCAYTMTQRQMRNSRALDSLLAIAHARRVIWWAEKAFFQENRSECRRFAHDQNESQIQLSDVFETRKSREF